MYVFGGNTQPKVIKKSAPNQWYCHNCDHDVNAWHRKCPTCQKPRKD